MLERTAGAEERPGNEVRLWVVLFSQLAIGVGATGIEISKRNIAQAIGSG